MTKFNLYDVVQVVRIPREIRPSEINKRPPRIGDTGTVVMVFETPSEGYLVEADDSKWLADFRPEDLEKVWIAKKQS